MLASDYRRIARESLYGRWPLAVGTGFVGALLGASTSVITSGGGTAAERGTAEYEEQEQMVRSFMEGELFQKIQPFIPWIVGALLIWVLLMLIVGGAITLGYVQFNLNLIDGKQVEFGDLFSHRHRLWEGFCMQFFQSMLVFFWSLLPFMGLVASYRYAMTPYILAEDMEIPVMEAITRSKNLMRGHKWELFCLDLSFLGWEILSILTLGIGFLWTGPYEEAAKAAFYREISE